MIVVGTLLIAACSDGAAARIRPTAATTSVDSSAADTTGAFPDAAPLEQPLDAPSGVPEELETVWEVWKLLAEQHVDRSKLDPEAISEGAIKGMLEVLGDQHTHYVRPEGFNIQNEDLDGSFEGIGAHVSMRRDGTLMIVAPLQGGPAEAAGLRPGDAVLEVDGVSIEGLSLLEAVARIRGPRGSDVVLLIKHLGAIDPTQVVITRDVIPLISVLLRSEPGDKLVHIRLTTFYADTAAKLAEMLENAVAAGAEGLILDVRDNPGGLLSSVVDVVGQFVEDGLVLYQVDADGKREPLKVRRGADATDIPMVLLTNEFSGSASEILAGALQDHDRATVIGATSFGKGSVNILRRLSNDGGLWITIRRWVTPSGRPIEGNGVEPDVEVVSRDRQKAETLQLEKAIEVLESIIDAKKSANASS